MAARRRSARSNEPSGYYFAVGPGREDDGWDCTVYMTDAVYFDMTGNPSDWRITPELTRGGMLLPPGLTEGAMGVFTYEGQPGEAQERLLARGFRMTAAFTSLVGVINLEREEREEYMPRPPPPPIPPGRDRVRPNPILVPAVTREALARGGLSPNTLGLYDALLSEGELPPARPNRLFSLGRDTPEDDVDLFPPSRRPRNPARGPRGRKEAVPKAPPGKTIWERLDEEDD
jgi:hypothetical protein